MTQRQILAALRKLVENYDSQRTAALTLNISSQYLNDVLRGRRQPGPKILKGLGLQKSEHYEKVR